MIYVFGSKPNRIKSNKIVHVRVESQFRFIDPIKTEPNRSNVLELFGLTLNSVDIESLSVGMTSVETSYGITFKYIVICFTFFHIFFLSCL